MTIEEALRGELRKVLDSKPFSSGKRTAMGHSPARDGYPRTDFHAMEMEYNRDVCFFQRNAEGSWVTVCAVPDDIVWDR